MTRWLTPDELRAWLKLAGVMLKLQPALDSQLQRDSDLTHFEYLSPDESGHLQPTAAGEQLRRLYGERDLLLALCLRDGFLDGLDAPGLAGVMTVRMRMLAGVHSFSVQNTQVCSKHGVRSFLIRVGVRGSHRAT